MDRMEERLYWLGFSLFPGIGPVKFSRLLSYFGTAKDAWNASLADLKQSKIGNVTAEEFIKFRNDSAIVSYEKKLREKNVQFLILTDKNYPSALKAIKNPPFLLYVKGDIGILSDDKLLAVVGTRKITRYGRDVTRSLTEELVHAGIGIVSGLALGVDAIAHETAVANKGKTIAVLGCGVDCCYPQENARLYSQILENNGMIVSEYGLGVMPNKGSFPSRNRIIAGLSLGVLVTEGTEDSGSLITARDAFANKRKVFAVPGPITSALSKGPNQLIAQGSTLVNTAEEILEELEIKGTRSTKSIRGIKGDSIEEQKIVDLLQNEPLHFDEIVRKTQIESSQLGSLLSLMEMKGLVKSLDAGMFGLSV